MTKIKNKKMAYATCLNKVETFCSVKKEIITHDGCHWGCSHNNDECVKHSKFLSNDYTCRNDGSCYGHGEFLCPEGVVFHAADENCENNNTADND